MTATAGTKLALQSIFIQGFLISRVQIQNMDKAKHYPPAHTYADRPQQASNYELFSRKKLEDTRLELE